MEDDIPFSQLANDAFESNPILPHGPTSFDHGVFNQAPNTTNTPTDATPARTPIHMYSDPFNAKHGKLINDPIHGCYRLDPVCTLIFDTRQFQRLRRLKQLGITYYVFPGASHNRFEHSLGVAHLAHKFTSQIWHAQGHELDIDRKDIQIVELAGLCHDIGHGPFSHVFEREFLRRKCITTWEHEEMSAKMLDFIVDENYIDALTNDDVARIKSLITAGHTVPDDINGTGTGTGKSKSSTKTWLREIVANGRNSIDVDKFDYLARDAAYCGMRVACDFNRIMQFSRVIDDEICYKYTEYMNLYELFHARASMHRSVYTHKKAKAIEFMVVDALLEADHALKISDDIWKPQDFVRLDDSILELIENFGLLSKVFGKTITQPSSKTAAINSNSNSIGDGIQLDDDSNIIESSIAKAQHIISRIRKRQLYKYVTDVPIPIEHLERGTWGKAPTPFEIASHYRGNGDIKLDEKDIIIHENKIDYSMRERNPLDSVHFFDYLESTEKRKLRPDQISSMVVAAFEEKRLRVYSRNPDHKYAAAVHQAFENWVHSRFGGHVNTSTPAKPIRMVLTKSDLVIAGGGRGGGIRGTGIGTSVGPLTGKGSGRGNTTTTDTTTTTTRSDVPSHLAAPATAEHRSKRGRNLSLSLEDAVDEKLPPTSSRKRT